MQILPQMKGKKLYFQYQVISTDRKGYTSKAEWFKVFLR